MDQKTIDILDRIGQKLGDQLKVRVNEQTPTINDLIDPLDYLLFTTILEEQKTK